MIIRLKYMKRKTVKGSVTLFVSCCLGIFIGLVMTLIYLCISNANKVRFEGITDIAMNSALGEYSVDLYEEYGLRYIDASYLCMTPSVGNLENRIEVYLQENCPESSLNWMNITADRPDVVRIQTAAAETGNSLRAQIGRIVQEMTGVSFLEETETNLDLYNLPNILGDWEDLMGLIAGMELPQRENPETKKLEDIPLNNPADEDFARAGCDILFLTGVNLDNVSNVRIPTDNLASHRSLTNLEPMASIPHVGNGAVTAYLFDSMGRYRNYHGHIMGCECEYVICGQESDYENLKCTADIIYMLVLADNFARDMSDANLIAEAYATAALLEVCAFSPQFIEPVAKSIIYAHTFRESIKDMKSILEGQSSKSGMTYDSFLGLFLICMDEKTMNLRIMDLMEMQMRIGYGNPSFSMDWCIERFHVNLTGGPGKYTINRSYGYY